MYILGISAFYHDSAACIIQDGEIIAAAQEERFTRIKHDHSFPHKAIKYCLREAKISHKEVSNIIFYEKPFLKFERLLETYLAFAPKGFKSFALAMPLWVKDKLFQKTVLNNELKNTFQDKSDLKDKIMFSEHHLSHAASAFFPSPYERAAILTLDGVGEWATTSMCIGNKNDLKIIKEIHFPHSLGLLYSAFTYYAGFKVNSGEYKLMGLAPYGKPKYENLIRDKLIYLADDGSFQLDLSYFDYATGLTMTNNKFNNLFSGPPRKPESKVTQKDMDIAASIQKVTEDVVINLCRGIAKETGEKNLCLAGGVALNCVANGKLLREKIFDNVWIQPAAGDAGGALGAALAFWYMHHKKERKIISSGDQMKGSYLGPNYKDVDIEKELNLCGAKFKLMDKSDLIETVAEEIANEKAVGLMQGRMEFGPRALGGRSIIADPRSPIMQKQLNLKVKYRESFRPFAPSILSEHASEWFDIRVDSPYMLLVADILEEKRVKISKKEEDLFGIEKLNIKRSSIPAITHVDYSARIQTVHKETNPFFYELLLKFYENTNCPVLINTSFNIRGEPIVCTPIDAYKCFMGTELDLLVVGNYILKKEEQDNQLNKKYHQKYELD